MAAEEEIQLQQQQHSILADSSCVICLEKKEETDLLVGLCGVKCTDVVCTTCLTTHCKTITASGYPGAAIRMSCPFHPRHVVPSRIWIPILKKCLTLKDSKDLLDKVSLHARNILSLQCGHCHTRRDLMRRTKKHIVENSLTALDTHPCTILREVYQKWIIPYLSGEISADYVIQQLKVFGTELDINATSAHSKSLKVSGTDSRKPFELLLDCIWDEERKATLHYAFLRRFPKVRTNCCRSWHCFRCHITGFHEKMSCEEFQASQAKIEDIIPCPGCGLQLTKGDGCDEVSCVCGKHFSWKTEVNKINMILTDLFTHEFPDGPANHAARILFEGHGPTPESLVRASAYASLNRPPVDKARVNLWDTLWPRHMRAVAAIEMKKVKKPNSREKAKMVLAKAWEVSHSAECKEIIWKQNYARSRAWNVAFGDLGDILRHRMTQSTCRLGPLPYLSSLVKYNKLDEFYYKDLETRQAAAWLFLHGNNEPKTILASFQELEDAEAGHGRGDTQALLCKAWVKRNSKLLDQHKATRFSYLHGVHVSEVALDIELELYDNPSPLHKDYKLHWMKKDFNKQLVEIEKWQRWIKANGNSHVKAVEAAMVQLCSPSEDMSLPMRVYFNSWFQKHKEFVDEEMTRLFTMAHENPAIAAIHIMARQMEEKDNGLLEPAEDKDHVTQVIYMKAWLGYDENKKQLEQAKIDYWNNLALRLVPPELVLQSKSTILDEHLTNRLPKKPLQESVSVEKAFLKDLKEKALKIAFLSSIFPIPPPPPLPTLDRKKYQSNGMRELSELKCEVEDVMTSSCSTNKPDVEAATDETIKCELPSPPAIILAVDMISGSREDFSWVDKLCFRAWQTRFGSQTVVHEMAKRWVNAHANPIDAAADAYEGHLKLTKASTMYLDSWTSVVNLEADQLEAHIFQRRKALAKDFSHGYIRIARRAVRIIEESKVGKDHKLLPGARAWAMSHPDEFFRMEARIEWERANGKESSGVSDQCIDQWFIENNEKKRKGTGDWICAKCGHAFETPSKMYIHQGFDCKKFF